MNQADLRPDLLVPSPGDATGGAANAAASAADPRASILVVDDTPANLSLLSSLLSPRWRVRLAPSGAKALALVKRQAPDLIVLDVMMPELDGYDVCRQLKADPATRDIPVLFITALSQPEDETRGFSCGGADFIHKPFNPATVLSRVATQLEAKAWRDALRQRNAGLQEALAERLAEVNLLREATLHVMISFAEFRDEDTGFHVRRTQEYVRTLAHWLAAQPGNAMQLDDERIDHIAKSAPLHDIGKVAIPDGILLKPGRLTADEMTVMRTHSMQGWEMLRRAAERMGDQGSLFLQYGMEIARHHHERWDGTGYPDGLAGEAIPLSARLMAVADVYDALISRRPYKAPMSHADARDFIVSASGGHFDPQVVQALLATQETLQDIARQWNDGSLLAEPPAEGLQ
jgi:putative two-component system response regulator